MRLESKMPNGSNEIHFSDDTEFIQLFYDRCSKQNRTTIKQEAYHLVFEPRQLTKVR